MSQINEAISSNEALLDQLYAFVVQPAPLNPLLASFFSKAFGVLFTRKSEQVRHFLFLSEFNINDSSLK